MLVLQVFQEHHDDVKQCYYVWFPLMSWASGPHTATQTFIRMEIVGGEGADVPHAGLRCEFIVCIQLTKTNYHQDMRMPHANYNINDI